MRLIHRAMDLLGRKRSRHQAGPDTSQTNAARHILAQALYPMKNLPSISGIGSWHTACSIDGVVVHLPFTQALARWRLLIPPVLGASLLALTACHAAADDEPIVSARMPLLSVGAPAPVESQVFDAPEEGVYGRVASSGTAHLAVWLGPRDAASETVVHAAFLADDAVPISGRRFDVAKGQVSSVEVAWSGSSFLVAWDAWSTPATGVFARRLSADGQWLDPAPRSLLDGASSVAQFGLASRSGETLLVWSGSAAGLRYARVDADANVLDPGGIELGSGASPVAAWDGANYVVAWMSDAGQANTRAARIATDGTLLDPGGKALGLTATSVVLGAGPGGRLLGWTRNLGGNIDCYSCNDDAYLTRLGPSLEVMDPDGIPIAVTSDGDEPDSVVPLGADFLVATTTGGRVKVNTVSANGHVGPSLGAVAEVFNARLAPTDSGAIAVLGGIGPILAAPISLAANQGLDSAAVVVSRRPNAQEAPAFAPTTAGGGLLVWNDDRGETPSVRARHVDGSGASPDLDSQLLGADTMFSPAVAWAADDYLIAWTSRETQSNEGRIRAHFLGTTPVLDLSGGEGLGKSPGASCIGPTCCVVWLDSIDDIWASLPKEGDHVAPDAMRVGQLPHPLEHPTWHPACLAMNGHFVVLWYQGAATVDLDATVQVSDAQDSGVPFYSFAAASNGRVGLAAWTEIHDAVPLLPGPTKVMLVGPQGQRQGAIITLESATEAEPWDPPPAAGWDGANFVVVVQGRAYRVAANGTVLDAAGGFSVERADTAAIAQASGSRVLYVGSRDDPSLGVARLFSQMIERGADSFPVGAGCLLDEECASGACEDSVCCSAACATGQACNLEGSVGQCAAESAGSTAAEPPATVPDDSGCAIGAGRATGGWQWLSMLGVGALMLRCCRLARIQRTSPSRTR